jgi:hypothetical protein
MGFPLWQREVRGDFIEISDSIGVLVSLSPIINDVEIDKKP